MGSSFSGKAILLHCRGWTTDRQILPKFHWGAIIPIPFNPSMSRKHPVSCGSGETSAGDCSYIPNSFYPLCGYKQAIEQGWLKTSDGTTTSLWVSAHVDREQRPRQRSNGFAAGMLPSIPSSMLLILFITCCTQPNLYVQVWISKCACHTWISWSVGVLPASPLCVLMERYRQ